MPDHEKASGVFAIAMRPSVVRRAAGYAVVVGVILILINHWDAVLAGDITSSRLAKMGLTSIVPYLVSTFSSAGAIRRAEDAARKQN